MRIKNFVLPFLAIFLFSCEGVDIDKEQASKNIQVFGSIEGMKTRVSGNTWSEGDAIGIFMKKSGESLLTESLAQNAKYITTGSSDFLPASEEEKVVFPFNGSNVDFVAYYPHKAEIEEFTYPVDVSNQTSQSDVDLLYADNAKGLNSKNPLVAMTFSHQLSKIVLDIKPEVPATDLSGLSVKITNAGLQASFSLADATLSAPAVLGDIVFNTNATGTRAEAILLPTNDLSGKDLVFTIGPDTYVYSLNSGLNITSFDKGTVYTYNVTLNPRAIPIINEGTITDWVTGPTEDIVLDPTNEYSTKGTKADPFTVEEAKQNQGRTNVWVTGYIVGSFQTNSDNFHSGSTGSSTTNLALADSPEDTEKAKLFSVVLPQGPRRDLFNPIDNPENVGKKVLFRGDIKTYLGIMGLNPFREGEFIDE